MYKLQGLIAAQMSLMLQFQANLAFWHHVSYSAWGKEQQERQQLQNWLCRNVTHLPLPGDGLAKLTPSFNIYLPGAWYEATCNHNHRLHFSDTQCIGWHRPKNQMNSLNNSFPHIALFSFMFSLEGTLLKSKKVSKENPLRTLRI